MSNRQSSRIGIIGHTLPAMVALAVGLGAAASATVLNVDGSAGCSDVTGTPYCTIQAALNAAANGDTLSVAAGTYNESPNVTKSVVVQSVSGRDATFINLQTGPTYLGSLTIGGANVTVDGFTIVGFDAVGNGLASTNILLNAGLGTVVVSNNRLQVGNPGVGSNGDDGMGLLTTYD